MDTVKESIGSQFDRCVRHYLENGPMGDRPLLDRIVSLAAPRPSDDVLDVACGAGLLAADLALEARTVTGIDLSSAMLAQADAMAASRLLGNISFRRGDVEALPFADESFDVVTCKLALHYFPDPERAVAEIRRVVRKDGRIVIVDRVAAEDPVQRAYHNCIEMLRTPTKHRVYATSEIKAILERHGLVVTSTESHKQYQAVEEWLVTTAAPEINLAEARDLLHRAMNHDLAGLNLYMDEGRLMMTHATAIIIAEKLATPYSRPSAAGSDPGSST